MTKVLDFIGELSLFGLRIIRDALRTPFELDEVWRQLAEVGSRSLALIASSGLALGVGMTLHTRGTLVTFGERLDAAVANMGDAVLAGATVIEGYSSDGTPGNQLAVSRSRSILVRQYLHNRFQLDLQNVGLVLSVPRLLHCPVKHAGTGSASSS